MRKGKSVAQARDAISKQRRGTPAFNQAVQRYLDAKKNYTERSRRIPRAERVTA